MYFIYFSACWSTSNLLCHIIFKFINQGSSRNFGLGALLFLADKQQKKGYHFLLGGGEGGTAIYKWPNLHVFAGGGGGGMYPFCPYPPMIKQINRQALIYLNFKNKRKQIIFFLSNEIEDKFILILFTLNIAENRWPKVTYTGSK